MSDSDLGCLGIVVVLGIAAAINVALGHLAHWCVGLFGYHGAPWYAYSVGILILGLVFKVGGSK